MSSPGTLASAWASTAVPSVIRPQDIQLACNETNTKGGAGILCFGIFHQSEG